jgi:hypothetical protein
MTGDTCGRPEEEKSSAQKIDGVFHTLLQINMSRLIGDRY